MNGYKQIAIPTIAGPTLLAPQVITFSSSLL